MSPLRRAASGAAAAVVLGIWGCSLQKPVPAQPAAPVSTISAISTGQEDVMKISSPDFAQGQPIPARFTCDGEDVSPALNWSGIPSQAKSLALVCDDPDAPMGTWVHWVVINLPVQTPGLPAGGPLPKGAVQVRNDFRKPDYGGPCPPNGTHRYFFKLYALGTDRLEGLTRSNFAAEIERHALAKAELMGTYRRQ